MTLLQTTLNAIKVGLFKVKAVLRRCWMFGDTVDIPVIMAGPA